MPYGNEDQPERSRRPECIFASNITAIKLDVPVKILRENTMLTFFTTGDETRTKMTKVIAYLL